MTDEPKRAAAYSHVAELFNPPAGGRFAASSAPLTQYPRQPEHSPWAAGVVGREPPIGFSVEEMPIVGEPHEVAASQETATRGTAAMSLPSPNVAGAVSPPINRRI